MSETTTRRLDLRFDVPDPERPDLSVVTILIDGEDLFATAGGPGFVGFPPEAILGRASPLLPSAEPRRVAVYCCCCGEPGCGVVAPLIVDDDGRISWTDFRDYTAVFGGPATFDPWHRPEV